MSAMTMTRATTRSPSLPRRLSNNQIYVDHEVSVVTSYSDVPPRPPSTSTSARPSRERLRSISDIANRQHPGSITSAISRIREANSRTTTMDSQLPRPLSPLPRPSYMQQRSFASARQYIDAESQSMRELADFLKNKPPPKENYMSIPDSTKVSEKERSTIGMFRRKSKKRQSAQQPPNIKLPDSAVAAKTSDGHWHIAISIPNEYYPSEGLPAEGKEKEKEEGKIIPKSSPQTPRPRAASKNSFGAVTVLKPVNEDRPLSVSDADPSALSNAIISRVFADERPRTNDNKALDRRIADLTAVKEIIAEKEAAERELTAIKGLAAQKEHAAQEEQAIREALAVENARSLDSTARQVTSERKTTFEPHMLHLEEAPRPGTGSTVREPSKPSRAYIGIAPEEDMQRQSSVRSDQRHSGGTIYSERSLTSESSPETITRDGFRRGHLRDVSTISSVPSMSDAVISTAQVGTNIIGHLEPPLRMSSRAPTANLVEVISTTVPDADGRARKRLSTQPIRSSLDENLLSESSDSRLSAADVDSNNDATNVKERPLSITSLETGRALSMNSSGPAPTRGLPDLPTGSPTKRGSKHSLRSDRKSRPTSTVSETNEILTTTRASSPGDESSDLQHSQSQDKIREQRKQRVRAIRSRDVEAERTRNSCVEVPNTAKLRSPSGQKSRPQAYLSIPDVSIDAKAQNSITEIMHVASTVPEFASYTILGPALGISPVTATPVEPTVQHLISSYRNTASHQQSQSKPISPAIATSLEPEYESNYIPSSNHQAQSEASNTTPRTIIPLRQTPPLIDPDFESRLSRVERNQEIILQSLTSVLTLGRSLSTVSQIISTRPSPNPESSQFTNTSSALPDPPFHPVYPGSLLRQNTQPIRRTTSSSVSATPQIDLTPWERELLERFERDRGSAVREVGMGLGDIEGLMKEVVGNSRISAEMTASGRESIETTMGTFEPDAGPFAGF